MPKDRNIYAAARELKGLTQEAAAERLDTSIESVRAYETDRRRPPDTMVLRMAQIYNFPYLCYQHIETGDLAGVVPHVEETGLQEAAMRLFRVIRRFAADHRTEQLLEIAEDGVIDADERPIFNEIMDELRDIIETGLAIKYTV